MHACTAAHLRCLNPFCHNDRCLSVKSAPVAHRSLLVAKAAAENATGKEAGLTEQKDLKEDILFKPFEEVHPFQQQHSRV